MRRMRFSVVHRIVVLAVAIPAVMVAQRARTNRGAGDGDAVPAVLPQKFVGPQTSGPILARDLMSRLYRFADDSMMGRLAGTRWNDFGTDFIASELKRFGLEPAGENGTYFQNALIHRAIAPSSRLSVGSERFELWKEFVPRDQGNTAAPVTNAVAVFGGTFGDASSLLAPELATGKVVVIRTGRNEKGEPDATRINRPQLTQRFATAAAIVVASTDYMPEGYIEEVYREPTLLPKSAPREGAIPLYMYVSKRAARAMLGVDVDSAATGRSGATVNAEVAVAITDAPGRNVIAVLRGSDPVLRNQYVAIGAHNDHIGYSRRPLDHDSIAAFMRIAAPQGADNEEPKPTGADWVRINRLKDSLRTAHGARADSIYNGADDDGSGSMGVLEVAERFATDRVRPKRSILFVWHVAEELGLFGSEYFTDHPTVPRDSIVAQLNMDMIGRGAATDVTGVSKSGAMLHGGPGYVQMVGGRRLSTELGDLLERVNLRQRHGLRFDYSLDADGHPQNIYCRSDHYEYARYGIPVAFLTTGGHADYHQVTDEPQYIDYRRAAQISRFIHGAATEIANLGHRIVVDKPKPDPLAECKQ